MKLLSYPEVTRFKWDEQRSRAALELASGKTHDETAAEVGCSRKTLHNWLTNEEFAAEVDRLSLMVDVSSRAQRLRLAMRVVRQKTKGNAIDTDKDLLEWLKFVQSETDGVKLDLSKLAATFAETEALVADRGSDRSSREEAVV